MGNEIRYKASQLASLVRQNYQLPTEDPVPIEELAENIGINISRRDLLRDIHATSNINGSNTEIILDPDLNELRERFTIAHEIGHFIIESSDVPDISNINISELSDQEIEGFCNEFAAQLLVSDASIQYVSKWKNFSIRRVADRGRELDVAVEPTLRRVLEVAKGDGGLLFFDRVNGVNEDRPFKLRRGLFPSSNTHAASNMSLIIPYTSDKFDPLLSAYEDGTEHLLHDMAINLEPFPGKSDMKTTARAKSYNNQLLLVLIPDNVSENEIKTKNSIVWTDNEK